MAFYQRRVAKSLPPSFCIRGKKEGIYLAKEPVELDLEPGEETNGKFSEVWLDVGSLV